jgi:hypothetical protein
MSIEFRYKTTAPELWCLTENLENLARFLVRRAQVKGPYELLGRMNVGSGAWREYEKRRLEKLKDAAEKEKYENGTFLPTCRGHPAPLEHPRNYHPKVHREPPASRVAHHKRSRHKLAFSKLTTRRASDQRTSEAGEGGTYRGTDGSKAGECDARPVSVCGYVWRAHGA